MAHNGHPLQAAPSTRKLSQGAVLLLFLLLGSWFSAARASAYVFWTNCPTCRTPTIVRANQNGSDVWPGFVYPHHTTIAEGLAISGDSLYWSWESPNYYQPFSPVVQDGVGKASLEGYGGEQFTFIGDSTPSYYPTGLAIAGKYLYTGYGNPGPMWSTKLDGPAPWHVSSASADASGVATSGGYIYWADDATDKIVRAKLNGSGGITETKNSFITGAHHPFGIALGGGYVYWANEATNSIGRAKLDGKSVEQKFITGAHRPRGVAVDGEYIYWANYDGSSIGRAQLDGKEVKQKFIGGQSHPEWVAVGGPPANTVAPKISGIPQQGEKLTEQHGSWLNGVSSYTYQWELCDSKGSYCVEIAGATHQTYTPSSADVGHRIVVEESAQNADGSSEPVSSAASAVVLPPPPANTVAPSISGIATQGQTLTGQHGSWSNDPTSFDYQWEDCDASGAACHPSPNEYTTGETYPLLLADAGHTIRLKVWAVGAGGTSAPAVSTATKVVLPLPPVNTVAPSIDGDLTQGQTLTDVAGSWTNEPSSYTYQWKACNPATLICTVVGSERTLLLGEAEVGDTIAVEESAVNTGDSGVPASSPTTAVVQGLPGTGNVMAMAPLSSIAPVISGQIALGEAVGASTGAWQGTPTLSYTYQWLLCRFSSCTDIADATNSTYMVPLFPLSDGGDTLEVAVTATNALGESTAESSDGTAVPIVTPPVHPIEGGGGSGGRGLPM